MLLHHLKYGTHSGNYLIPSLPNPIVTICMGMEFATYVLWIRGIVGHRDLCAVRESTCTSIHAGLHAPEHGAISNCLRSEHILEQSSMGVGENGDSRQVVRDGDAAVVTGHLTDQYLAQIWAFSKTSNKKNILFANTCRRQVRGYISFRWLTSTLNPAICFLTAATISSMQGSKKEETVSLKILKGPRY